MEANGAGSRQRLAFFAVDDGEAITHLLAVPDDRLRDRGRGVGRVNGETALRAGASTPVGFSRDAGVFS